LVSISISGQFVLLGLWCLCEAFSFPGYRIQAFNSPPVSSHLFQPLPFALNFANKKALSFEQKISVLAEKLVLWPFPPVFKIY